MKNIKLKLISLRYFSSDQQLNAINQIESLISASPNAKISTSIFRPSIHFVLLLKHFN